MTQYIGDLCARLTNFIILLFDSDFSLYAPYSVYKNYSYYFISSSYIMTIYTRVLFFEYDVIENSILFVKEIILSLYLKLTKMNVIFFYCS